MGRYFRWACHEADSHISPDDFDENVKYPEDSPKTLKAVTLLMRFGTWSGYAVYLEPDDDDTFYESCQDSAAAEAKALMEVHQ